MDKDNEKGIDYSLEVGISGLNRTGGWVFEEWLNDLKGIKGINHYKEMRDNDAVVGAFLFAVEMLIRQVKWRVDKAGDSQEDEDAAEFVEQCLFEDMEGTWQELISEILTELTFGWAYFEMVFKRRTGETDDQKTSSKFNDGRIGFRKIALRAQESFWKWEFDDQNNLLGLWQQAPPDWKLRYIPYEKALLFNVWKQKGNPEGRSFLRNAYRSWYFKKRIEEIEGIGIERDLAGMPVVHVPASMLSANATEEQKASVNNMLNLVKNVRRDETDGIVFPSETNSDGTSTGYKFELLSTGSRRTIDIGPTIERYDKRILMTVLADFIMLGQSGVGSFALSSDKTELFSMAIGAILEGICEVFNSKAIPLLMKLNSFSGLNGMPKLAHSDIETPNLSELGQFIQSISNAGAGLFPNEELTNYLLKISGLPEMTEEQLERARQASDAKMMQMQNPFSMMAKRLKKNESIRKITDDQEKRIEAEFEKFRDALGSEFENMKNGFINYLDDVAQNPEAMIEAVESYQFTDKEFRDMVMKHINFFYNAGWDTVQAYADNAAGDDGRPGFSTAELTEKFHSARGARIEAATGAFDEAFSNIDIATSNMIKQTIAECLKEEMTWDEIRDAIMECYGLSDERASLIARTESGYAYNRGYIEAGIDSGVVIAERIHDGDSCDPCSVADGSLWSPEFASAHIIEHPNCFREMEHVYTPDLFPDVTADGSYVDHSQEIYRIRQQCKDDEAAYIAAGGKSYT